MAANGMDIEGSEGEEVRRAWREQREREAREWNGRWSWGEREEKQQYEKMREVLHEKAKSKSEKSEMGNV